MNIVPISLSDMVLKLDDIQTIQYWMMYWNETAQDGDWKTLGGGEFTSDRMNELVGRQYGDMMNGTQQVPSSDPMAQFLNKDYREVLEKTEEKQKQKYGR